MAINITYFKPASTRGLTAHDCGGPQFVQVLGQVPTLLPLNPALCLHLLPQVICIPITACFPRQVSRFW